MPSSSSAAHGGDSVDGSAPSPSPVVISTWPHGLLANEVAWCVLSDGGTALDAVESGAAVPETDPEVQTVGLGGRPDRSGTVTVDACVMDERWRCWAVAAPPRIQQPTAVARAVMEKTPHVMLAGNGALAYDPGRPVRGRRGGAACATGWGEAVIRVAGSHLAVEAMRQRRRRRQHDDASLSGSTTCLQVHPTCR